MDLNFFKTVTSAGASTGGAFPRSLDGRVKTVFFLVSIVAAAAVTHWYLAAVLWMAALVLYSLLRLPWRLLAGRLAIPLGIAWLVFLNMLVTTPGHPLWVVLRKPFPLAVSAEGLDLGLLMMLRIMAAVTLAFGLSLSTPMVDILETLRLFRLPGVMIDVAEMMFRYVFILSDVARNMSRAQLCRTVRKPSWVERTRNVGQVAAHVVTKSVDRSVRIYSAMLARGLSEETAAPDYFIKPVPASDLRLGLLLLCLPLAVLACNFVL
jgi:cobalt/nickel transport system permease protein